MSEDNRYHPDPVHAAADPAGPDEDAALDALLARFGADYNRPPDIVPREEMWHQIRQRNVPRGLIRRHPTWSVMIAAALLLGAGIAIGVEAHSRVAAQADVANAERPAQAAPVRDGGADAVSGIATGRPPLYAVVPSSPVQTGGARPGGAVASPMDASARSTAYRLATMRHFTAVEALLTSYQTTTHDSRGDAQMSAWARALLSQTRLLLDSPAATDPVRRKLLQDLELVLVQMTQLSPADTPIDREMLDGTVRQSDVITRLRTAVPAGGTTHL